MSNPYSDPLFVRAEVDYRLERFGGPAFSRRREVWPDLGPRLLRRLRHRRRPHPSAARPPVARQRVLHP